MNTRELDTYTASLQQCFGSSLLSVVLYGSAVNNPDDSANANVLVVLSECPLLTLMKVKKIADIAARARIETLFWTKEEMKNAADVFPLEFTEITASHRILAGTDIISGTKVTKTNMRHQIEFELRTKLLTLRRSYLDAGGNASRMRDALADVSLIHLFKYAMKLAKISDPSMMVPLERCRDLKRGKVHLSAKALHVLFNDIHEVLCTVIRAVDNA
ncbi:MAG: hypothetical protein HZC28_02740 [Spirochaetes bacterium]|nr:hypothetical protein [Spirochaetota bacterium]